ncbi:MAG TPA: hypothetical protein VGN95_11840 [Pyrinomonadaceae bacterium]|nr:hypothetical protein [Pyrinomonadaceae bacterium]
MLRKVNLFIALLATVLVIATNAPAQKQTNGCNCAYASLVGDTVGTQFGGGPVANRTVNSAVELPNAGPILGAAGNAPRWNIDYGSNTIRVDFLQQVATYGAGASFVFSSLDPQLAGCPPAFISGITVTTNKPAVPFNVVAAATFGPHTVTIQIAPNGANIDWKPGEFILVRLNFACSTTPPPLSLSCCECLGKVTTLDLSTGQGSPVDPLWQVNGSAAYTTPPYPGWTTSLSPANWIQPVPSPTPANNVAAVLFKYTVQFNIPKCTIPSEVRLDAKWAADNSGKVYLDNNSTPVASCTVSTCFQTGVAQPFTLTGLTPGLHTLRFEVKNDGGPSGLIVNAKLTRQCKKELQLPGDSQTGVDFSQSAVTPRLETSPVRTDPIRRRNN